MTCTLKVSHMVTMVLTMSAGSAVAQDATKQQTGFISNPEKYVAATSVDFSSELGLNFASLSGLGARIEQCRTVRPDPVGLAATAKELGVAEKVSGKKANLTSAALMKEAVEMAKVRFDAQELRGLLLYVDDEDCHDELEIIAHSAMQAAKGRRNNGIRANAVSVTLSVHNKSSRSARVFYNQRFVGTLKPNGREEFLVEQRGPYLELTAFGPKTCWRHRGSRVRAKCNWTIGTGK